MTAQTAAPRTRADLEGVRLQPGGIIASEVLKLVTVRSTWWSIGVSVALAFGLALLLGASFTSSDAAVLGGSSLVLSGSTIHLQFVGLVIAVLGALSIGGEYSTGMIRSTYTAVPHRVPSLIARGLVVGVAAFAVGLVTTSGSFVIVSSMLAGKGAEASLADDGVVAALLGGALYLAVVGVFSVGLGALFRSTAAAIGVAVGILFVLPVVASIAGALLRAQWIADASRLLLSDLGMRISSLGGEGSLGTTAVFIALALWVVVVWVPALALTRLRDV